MAGYNSFTLMDHGGEKSVMSFYTPNITGTLLPNTVTQFNALRSAIIGITLGTVVQEELSLFRNKLSNALPATPNAQRERKWLVVYEDVTEFLNPPTNTIRNEGYRKVFTLEIATANLVGNLQPNSDEANLSATPVAAFVTAFETLARSPYGGQVNVLKLVAVGRNL
jgi:hypothetical protein